jgi:uncharacterized protein
MQAAVDPAILFFVFGVFAGLIRSNLEIPPAISRFLSLYLLMALGLKGGFALAESGLNAQVLISLSAAVFMAALVPLLSYAVLSRMLGRFDAAAIAATYGSVSAVTFITAAQYLDHHGLAYGGHMAAAMALMESPAIILAVLFANMARAKTQAVQSGVASTPSSMGHVWHEALTDGAQLLLLGAMLIGFFAGEQGQEVMKPFSVDLFKGMLSFFLLDMGLLAARNMGKLRGQPKTLLMYALLAPLVHAFLAMLLGGYLNMSPGDLALLMVLSASASYIAVPAVLRHAIPEANPSLYFGMSLGLTFPFNILLGIPLYVQAAFAWSGWLAR